MREQLANRARPISPLCVDILNSRSVLAGHANYSAKIAKISERARKSPPCAIFRVSFLCPSADGRLAEARRVAALLWGRQMTSRVKNYANSQKKIASSEGSLRSLKDRRPSPQLLSSGKAPAGICFDFAQIDIARPDPYPLVSGALATAGDALPYREQLQPLFGEHNLGNIRSVSNGTAQEACAELGALGFAQGERVGFGQAPDLLTAAHEAAHVIQQRAGRTPAAGLSPAGDPLEQQADRVASLVSRGQSAAPALAGLHPTGWSLTPATSASQAVQLRLAPNARAAEIPDKAIDPSDPEVIALFRQHGVNSISELLKSTKYDQLIADRVTFEVQLGQLIMDHFYLFAESIQKMTAGIKRFMEQFINKLKDIEYDPLRAPVASLLLQLVNKISAATADLNSGGGTPADIEKINKSLRIARDAQYWFNEYVYTAKTPDDRDSYSFYDKERRKLNKQEAEAEDRAVGAARADIHVGRERSPQERAGDRKSLSSSGAMRREATLNEEMPLASAGQDAELVRGARRAIETGFSNRLRTRTPEAEKEVFPDSPEITGDTMWNVHYFHKNKVNMFSLLQDYKYAMPVFATISGTMSDLLTMARNFGLSGSDLVDYVTANIGVMLGEKHHSFHEIAIVLSANQIFRYVPGDYRSLLAQLPKKLTMLPAFQALLTQHELVLKPVG